MSKLSWGNMGNLRKSSYTYDFKEIFLSLFQHKLGSENTNTIRLISQPVAFMFIGQVRRMFLKRKTNLSNPFPMLI